MLRNVVGRSAAAVVGAALIGGGLVLGGGTASAQEVQAGAGDIASGSVEIANGISVAFFDAVFPVLTAGSSETIGCTPTQDANCPTLG